MRRSAALNWARLAIASPSAAVKSDTTLSMLLLRASRWREVMEVLLGVLQRWRDKREVKAKGKRGRSTSSARKRQVGRRPIGGVAGLQTPTWAGYRRIRFCARTMAEPLVVVSLLYGYRVPGVGEGGFRRTVLAHSALSERSAPSHQHEVHQCTIHYAVRESDCSRFLGARGFGQFSSNGGEWRGAPRRSGPSSRPR